MSVGALIGAWGFVVLAVLRTAWAAFVRPAGLTAEDWLAAIALLFLARICQAAYLASIQHGYLSAILNSVTPQHEMRPKYKTPSRPGTESWH